MKLTDVTVLGELNIDLLFNQLDTFPKTGKEIIANEMALSLGSSSAIFAANLSALGASVQFMGKLGKDLFGQFILRTLEERKVQTGTILQDTELATGATVILNMEQDRAMVTHPGAMASFHSSEIDWNEVYKSRHLHLSSVFLQPGLQSDIVSIFKRAKEAGISTSLDTQWDPSGNWQLPLNELLPYVDLFLPNEAELCLLTGEDELNNAIAAIRPSMSVLVVKMGIKGSICIKDDQERFLSARKMDSFVDAIGAGDSYNAGFIYQWLNGKSLDQCQDFGNICGAFSTTAAGGIAAFNNLQNIPSNVSTIA